MDGSERPLLKGRAGRQQTFEDFVQREAESLGRTAYLLTGSRSDAEDLLQDALERTFRHWRRREITTPAAYVHRVMVNLCISRWRRHRPHLVVDEADRLVADMADMSDAVVVRAELMRALGALPERQRAVLVLRYWEDYSEQDTARLLGCAVGTVKSQASRALGRLRDVEMNGWSGSSRSAEQSGLPEEVRYAL
jgi:RNA polymerase sigma-70 factor (sigma-E family)